MNDIELARGRFAVLEGIPLGVFVLRRDFVVLFWNACLESWTGVSADQIVGELITERFPHLASPVYAGRLEMIFMGGPPTLFSSHLHKYFIPAHLPDEKFRAQQTTVSGVPDPESGEYHALTVIEDVTDLNRRLGDYRAARDRCKLEIAEREHAVRGLSDTRRDLERRVADRTAELTDANRVLQEEIGERRSAEKEIRRAHAETSRLLMAMSDILIGIDARRLITHWNSAASIAFGLPESEALGKPFDESGISWDWSTVLGAVDRCIRTGERVRIEDFRFGQATGKQGLLRLSLFAITPDGEASGVLLIGEDVTERRVLEGQLAQAQKLEAIGQLAAGIAHEINTPIQYISDNTSFLRDSFEALSGLLSEHTSLLKAARDEEMSSAALEAIETAQRGVDLKFLEEEIPKAIKESMNGLDRVASIVRAMKEFSHPGSEEKTSVDLNRALESTITVARNEWKYVAEVVTDLDPDLPEASCYPAELNQVFLNLLVNAAHAIGGTTKAEQTVKGTIGIRTRLAGEWLEVEVSDTGSGIPAEIQDRIFDPFFTTKRLGKGTGQGLAIAYSVVVEKHQGTIHFETEIGKGTRFIVRLPQGPGI